MIKRSSGPLRSLVRVREEASEIGSSRVGARRGGCRSARPDRLRDIGPCVGAHAKWPVSLFWTPIGTIKGDMSWELSRPGDLKATTCFVRPDDMPACVRISHDLSRDTASPSHASANFIDLQRVS
jgi:hypothetical protein